MLQHPDLQRADPATYAGTAPVRARRGVDPAGPIVVAVGGGDGSPTPLVLARHLAGAADADVAVVTVAEPPMVLDPHMGAGAYPFDGAPWLRDARAVVSRQMARADVADTEWPVEVLVGEPARRLAAHVRSTEARLVMLGRARHGWIHARYASRLALRLLRLADVPVLSVAATLADLPRRLVAAVDFSPYSAHAARIAISLAAPDALVHLVHVRPREVPPATVGAEGGYDAQAVSEAWTRFRAALGDVGDRQVETVTIAGNPGHALVEYAHAAAADLVATGTHGRGFLDRLVLGSVAETVLQQVDCSVLCVPGSAFARAEHRRLAIAGLRTHRVPRTEWSATLADLTGAARGRPCSMEVDHPSMGAQRLVEGLPFAGAGLDEREERLVLTFGVAHGAAIGAREMVLTHAVPGLRTLEVVRDARGDVQVLRAADEVGQTLLTFTE